MTVKYQYVYDKWYPIMGRHDCLTQLKHVMDRECNICKNSNNENQFFKYKFVYDNK